MLFFQFPSRMPIITDMFIYNHYNHVCFSIFTIYILFFMHKNHVCCNYTAAECSDFKKLTS